MSKDKAEEFKAKLKALMEEYEVSFTNKRFNDKEEIIKQYPDGIVMIVDKWIEPDDL